MTLAQEIISDIENALKQFGEYTYYDKGAHEVMDVDKFNDRIKQMTFAEVETLLREIEQHEHGSQFLTSLICGLDNWDKFDDYCNNCPTFASYY